MVLCGNKEICFVQGEAYGYMERRLCKYANEDMGFTSCQIKKSRTKVYVTSEQYEALINAKN